MIHVESGVHLLIRVTRRRIFHHRDFIAELSRITNSCLHTRLCDEPHDDELMDAMFLELQIQIRVGETTGTPMLLGDDFARLRGRIRGGFRRPTCRIRRSFATRLPSESAQCTSRSRNRQGDIDDAAHRKPECPPFAQHPGLASYEEHIVGFSNTLQAVPYFAALGDEIVIWIDHKKCSDLLLICHCCAFPHPPPHWPPSLASRRRAAARRRCRRSRP